MAQKARATVLRAGRAGFWMSSEKYSGGSMPFFQEDSARDLIKFVLTSDTEILRIFRDIKLHYRYSRQFSRAFLSDYYDCYWNAFGNSYAILDDEFPALNIMSEATDMTMVAEFMTIQFIKSNGWATVDVKIMKTSSVDSPDIELYSEACLELLDLWSIAGIGVCSIEKPESL